MRNLLIIGGLTLLAAACNPTYLPIEPTGIAQVEEFEVGGFGSFGYVGRKIRPVGFRGLVANFGVYLRKGIKDGVDLTVAVDNCSLNGALGFRQDIDGNAVLRPRLGLGWLSGFAGVDYATRLSEGEITNYSVGGSAFAWIGDAYWTDDPGRSYGLRLGGFGHTGSEPRWQSTVSGGLRLDWAPLQFGGKGAPETIVDFFGGSRNPYAEPIDRGILRNWPAPTFAFEPGALVLTGGPAVTYHHKGANWKPGGEKEEEEREEE
ncbi:MAG: hypothetical protein GX444_14665 [Myxococcales bacterium]|nr:hypothetical protein [Myxococcales bacterium]